MSIATAPVAFDPVAVNRMAGPIRYLRTAFEREFLEYFEKHKSLGFDVLGKQRPYLSRAAQLEFWSQQRLRQAQLPLPSPANTETLRNKYIGVFSMLTYCGQLEYFKDYFLTPGIGDASFPLTHRPPQWPTAPRLNELFHDVQEYQYLFFPRVFDDDLHDRMIPPEQVLPITSWELLRKGDHGEADVYKIQLDPTYNELKIANDEPIQDTFVLKIQSSESSHKHEVAALSLFRTNTEPNIIGFYGSFIQQNGRCLILEYVDGSNLLSYLQRTPPPQEPSDRLLFWKSYSGYLKGLRRIHQVADSSAIGDFRGVHGDLKPDNLLLKMGRSGNPYDFEAKVTDFGCSHFRLVDAGGEDRRNLDRHGNQQYCAPEASHYTEFLETGPNRIDFAADIFSFGAVTSEVITWMGLGHDGIDRYFTRRKQAVEENDSFNGSGYAGCFHNGVDPWPEVRDMHQEVRNALPSSDHITPKMIDLVEYHMLLGPAGKRNNALTLVKKFDNYHQEAAKVMLGRRPDSFISPTSPPGNTPVLPEGPSSAPQTPRRSLPLRPTMYGHDRTLSNESSVGTMSPTRSLASSPFSPLQRPVSWTLDGVTDEEGRSVCPASCEAQPPRPKLRPIVTRSPASSAAENFIANTSPQNDTVTDTRQTPCTLGIPGPSGHVSGRTSTSSARPRPDLKLDELRRFWEYKKGHPSTISTQVLSDIEKLQQCIHGRDHIFYIDDSDTMAAFKSDVEDAFKLMSYIAKQVDRDGIEMYMGSNPTKRFAGKRTTALADKLREHWSNKLSEMMEHNFGMFVEELSRRLGCLSNGNKNGISIIVFTDGQWGGSLDREVDVEKAAGVERPIRDLLQQMANKGIRHAGVMISFVRFGQDELGRRHLEYLDEFGKKEVFRGQHGNDYSYDIIDTGPVSGNIYKLFVGSIIQGNDDDNG